MSNSPMTGYTVIPFFYAEIHTGETVSPYLKKYTNSHRNPLHINEEIVFWTFLLIATLFQEARLYLNKT